MSKKVLFTHPVFEEGVVELKEKGYDVMVPDHVPTRQEMLDIIPEYDAIVIPWFKADKEVIDIGKNLKMIVPYGIGYDNVDVKTATEQGVVVANVRAVREPTAELGASLIIAAMRNVAQINLRFRQAPGFKWGPMSNLGYSLRGKTLGIIGMGHIGASAAKRLVPWGMNVIYHNRHEVDPKLAEELGGAKLVSLEELMKTADVVYCAANLSPETYHIVGKEQLELMKPTAIIANTGRGSLIDEAALIEHLKAGKIWGAALDVFETEPNINPELLAMENVVCTAHMGTATFDDKIAMTKECCQNIINFFEKGEVPNCVNPDVLQNLKK